MKLALAVLIFVSAIARAETNTDLQADIQSLTKQIEAKFGLEAKVYENSSTIAFKKPMKTELTLRYGEYINEINVAWPIYVEESKPEETKAMLIQILAAKKSLVNKVADAYVNLQYEENQLEWNESISAYIPNAYPAETRQSERGEVYWLSVPYITNPKIVNGRTWTSGGSSALVGEIMVPTTNLAVVLKYPGVSIYEKGDLKRAIIANEETRKKLVAQIYKNISNFEFNRNNTYGLRFEGCIGSDCKYSVINWANIVKSYEK